MTSLGGYSRRTQTAGKSVTQTVAREPAGSAITHVTNLNYQGMELNTTDISAKQSMHIDLWSEASGAVKFF